MQTHTRHDKFRAAQNSQVFNLSPFSNFCVKGSFNFDEIFRNNSCLSDQMCSFDIKSLSPTCHLMKKLPSVSKNCRIQISVYNWFPKRYVGVCCTWQLRMLILDLTTVFIDKLLLSPWWLIWVLCWRVYVSAISTLILFTSIEKLLNFR